GSTSVAMVTQSPGIAIDQAISASIRDAARWLEDAGYRVEEVTPPRLEEAAEMFFTLVRTEEKAGMTKAIERFGDAALRRARASTMAYASELDFEGYIKHLRGELQSCARGCCFSNAIRFWSGRSPGKDRLQSTSTNKVTTQSGGCSPPIIRCSRSRSWGCPRSPSRPVLQTAYRSGCNSSQRDFTSTFV